MPPNGVTVLSGGDRSTWILQSAKRLPFSPRDSDSLINTVTIKPERDPPNYPWTEIQLLHQSCVNN